MSISRQAKSLLQRSQSLEISVVSLQENDDQEFANQGAMEESSSFGAISSGQKNERIPITPHSVLTFLFYLTVAIRYALHLGTY